MVGCFVGGWVGRSVGRSFCWWVSGWFVGLFGFGFGLLSDAYHLGSPQDKTTDGLITLVDSGGLCRLFIFGEREKGKGVGERWSLLKCLRLDVHSCLRRARQRYASTALPTAKRERGPDNTYLLRSVCWLVSAGWLGWLSLSAGTMRVRWVNPTSLK